MNVNQISGDGFTALHIACNCDKIDMAQYLMLEGATLNKRDRNGATPLDLCRSASVREMVLKRQGGPGGGLSAGLTAGLTPDVHVTYMEEKSSTSLALAESSAAAAGVDGGKEVDGTIQLISPLSIGLSDLQVVDPVDCRLEREESSTLRNNRMLTPTSESKTINHNRNSTPSSESKVVTTDCHFTPITESKLANADHSSVPLSAVKLSADRDLSAFSEGSPSSPQSFSSSPSLSVLEKIRNFEKKNTPAVILIPVRRGSGSRRNSGPNVQPPNSNIAPAKSYDDLAKAGSGGASHSASMSSFATSGTDPGPLDLSGVRFEQEMEGDGDSDDEAREKRRLPRVKQSIESGSQTPGSVVSVAVTEPAEGKILSARPDIEVANSGTDAECEANSRLLSSISGTNVDFDGYPRLLSSQDIPLLASDGAPASVSSPLSLLSPLTPASHPYDDISDHSRPPIRVVQSNQSNQSNNYHYQENPMKKYSQNNRSSENNQNSESSEVNQSQITTEEGVSLESVALACSAGEMGKKGDRKPSALEPSPTLDRERLVPISALQDQAARRLGSDSDVMASIRSGWSWSNEELLCSSAQPERGVPEGTFSKGNGDVDDEGADYAARTDIEGAGEELSERQDEVEGRECSMDGMLLSPLSDSDVGGEEAESSIADARSATTLASFLDTVIETEEEDCLTPDGVSFLLSVSEDKSDDNDGSPLVPDSSEPSPSLLLPPHGCNEAKLHAESDSNSSCGVESSDSLQAMLRAAIDEKAVLLARITVLEEEARQFKLMSQYTSNAAAEAVHQIEEEAEHLKEEAVLLKKETLNLKKLLSAVTDDAKRVVDEKEEANAVLVAELEVARVNLSEAGEGVRLSNSKREDLEHRALQAMMKLESKLESEGSARSAAEERAMESERERDMLRAFAGEGGEPGSLLTPKRTPNRGERSAEQQNSPTSLLALTASPSTLASLHTLYRNLGALLEDGGDRGGGAVLHPTGGDDFGWADTGSTVDDRRMDNAEGSKKTASQDVLVAFEDIYPSPERSRRLSLPKSILASDGDDWEASEPNPLHRAVSKNSSPRASLEGTKLMKAAEAAATVEQLHFQPSRVRASDDEVRFEDIYSGSLGEAARSIWNVLDNSVEAETEVEETEGGGVREGGGDDEDDGEELLGISVLRDVDCLDGILFDEGVEEVSEIEAFNEVDAVKDADGGSPDEEISADTGSDRAAPQCKEKRQGKPRRRSFMADDQSLMLRLDSSLSSIYSSLETLCMRTIAGSLSAPAENSLAHTCETRKLRVAWQRLSEYTTSRDDLLALGPFPPAIQALMKQNEGVLWAMFRCYYPPNCRALPSVAPSDSSNSRNEYRRKVLSVSSIWDLLRDFNVCPDLCTYVHKFLALPLTSDASPTVLNHYLSPHVPQ